MPRLPGAELTRLSSTNSYRLLTAPIARAPPTADCLDTPSAACSPFTRFEKQPALFQRIVAASPALQPDDVILKEASRALRLYPQKFALISPSGATMNWGSRRPQPNSPGSSTNSNRRASTIASRYIPGKTTTPFGWSRSLRAFTGFTALPNRRARFRGQLSPG